MRDTQSAPPVGSLLREWRARRRMSQLDLAFEADISSRHLSFVETGRSRPSREMVLHLAERLEIPLRERNTLLTAAGYAPLFPERPLDAPALEAARRAVEMLVAGHEPYPALAVDRHWTLLTSNRALDPLLTGIAAFLLEPPVNVLRLGLHPAGLAPRIANFAEWRFHLLERLRHQIRATADPALTALLDELSGYPMPDGSDPGTPMVADNDYTGMVVPFRLITEQGILAFFSTTTLFGTPLDVTLSEIAIESFFPADTATAEALHRLAAGRT